MPEYRVLRIDEQLYGCEELPAGQPVLCDVTLTDAAGAARILPYPDRELTCLGIDEGDTVCLLPDGTLHKLKGVILCIISISPATARRYGTWKIRSAA